MPVKTDNLNVPLACIVGNNVGSKSLRLGNTSRSERANGLRFWLKQPVKSTHFYLYRCSYIDWNT